MIYMVIGGVLVAALVAWALTRSVAPSATTSVMTDAPAASTAAAPFTASAPPTPIPTASDPTNTAFTPPAQFNQHPQDPATAGVSRVSAEDLRAKVFQGRVTVIDVRDEASYVAGHIAGALHIPMARIEGEIGYLPKGKEIVTYCT